MPSNKTKATGDINRLEQSVIAQIAAGEVIEHPASALKELVENSIDAGAKNILVHVENGSLAELTVTDDGKGISMDELALAVQPHTTSKLSAIDELEGIKTLGFRGEGLAAICSLSNTTISSRTKDSENGAKLELKGSWENEMPVANVMPCGTQISVRDIFTHAPARRKFLKSPRSEWSYCEVALTKIMIPYPDVSIIATVEKYERFNFPSTSQEERIFQFLGEKFKDNALVINNRSGPISVSGYINLELSGTAGRKHIYINNRSVVDPLINQAINKAFNDSARRTNVPYVVFLTIPPQLFDVNAHPTKSEVRFIEPRAIFQFIYKAFTKIAESPIGQNPMMSLSTVFKDRQEDMRKEAIAHRRNKPIPTPKNKLYDLPEKLFTKEGERRQMDGSDKLALSILNAAKDVDTEFEKNGFPKDLGTIIGMFQGIYLLTEHENGIIVIDIHAAHERILYEELKKTSGKKDNAQALLEPIELNLTPIEMDAIVDYRKLLKKQGLHFKNKAGVEYLEAVPAVLAKSNINYQELVATCIDDLVKYGYVEKVEDAVNQVLGTMACYSAVRGSNPHKSKKELESLLEQMKVTLRSGKCNHGRPCWRMLRLYDLDLCFERGR